MLNLSIDEIVKITGARVALDKGLPANLVVTGYSFDTRRLEEGDLFFALEGERRDGHTFVGEARTRGAVAAVVSHPVEGAGEDFVQIVVESPLAALQSIASHERGRLDIPVVTISGSNGKTTTKDMLAMLLASKMRVHKSPGNFNNHIGVPLSLLGLDDADQVLVIEIGSNHRGEIRNLCEIARPTVGLVTNVGRAHIGYFGSVDEIAREKTDILRCLEPGGTGIVNADDPLLLSAIAGIDVDLLTFGVKEAADFRATDIRQIDGRGAEFSVNGVAMRLRSPGLHNIYNATAAIAAAGLFDISPDDAGRILTDFEPLRMKVMKAADLTIIDDSYNANPDSVKAALDVFSSMGKTRKVFVMGEMLELGDSADRLHREVGTWVTSSGVDVLIGIGGLTRATVDEARASGMSPESALFFEDKTDAMQQMSHLIAPHDVVLVKGSRMAGLEEICDLLKQQAVEGRA
ncbi:MAG: UDP-N-acetylmuramoyl-tripeptide--D-alanyl-D-alanine ligase [Candidatus Eisenbacteria bacterium]